MVGHREKWAQWPPSVRTRMCVRVGLGAEGYGGALPRMAACADCVVWWAQVAVFKDCSNNNFTAAGVVASLAAAQQQALRACGAAAASKVRVHACMRACEWPALPAASCHASVRQWRTEMR